MTDRPSPVQLRPGSFEQALANGQQLLDRDPSAALKQAETLIRLRRDPAVFRLAAAAGRRLGMKAEAEAAELNGIQAALADPELEKASIAESEGRRRDAQRICDTFLIRNPHDLLAMTLRAEASIGLWQLDEAERLLRRVLGRAPSFLRAAMMLIKCLQRQSRPRQAVDLARAVLQRKPKNLAALTYLTQLLTEVGDPEQTIVTSERILSLDGTEPDRWIHYAHQLRIVGRQDDAIQAFRHALEIRPENGAAWWGLANYYPAAINQQDVTKIADVLALAVGTQDESTLNLALGLIAGREGEYERSFRHIAAGKRLRLEAFPFDPDRTSATVDEALRAYSPEFFKQREAVGSSDSSPIFLIGMHRSGSTLVERILGRHSQVQGAGELPVLPRLVRTLLSSVGEARNLEEQLAAVAPDDLRRLGGEYVDRTADYRQSSKPRFIDKLNFNWMHLAFIRSALPNARIIDVRRNAVDCCWANFKMLFTEGHPASNDLRHIGRFYREYVRFADGIDRAAPGGALRVQYEDVVDDLEGQTRRMLDFLGLEFEPQCLDFHLSEGAVATASSEQVRQPLNRKGIGSAEPYRQWLGPLIEELGPLADQ